LSEETRILLLCRHDELAKTLLRVITDKSPWTVAEFDYHSASIDQLAQQNFDILLVGSGFSEEEESRLDHYIRTERPNVHIIFHYGGGSGILYSEVLHALDQSKSQELSF
jgi:hypothetical protein